MNQDNDKSSVANAALDQLVAELRISQNASDMLDEAFAALLGVNRTDGRCLDIVQRLGQITAGELAQRAGLTSGAVTTVIDRMERAGYLRRIRDGRDRRKVHVALTELAEELGQVVYSQVAAIGRDHLGRIPARDVSAITAFLRTSAVINEHLAELMRKALQFRAPASEQAQWFATHAAAEARSVGLKVASGPRP